jgi:hypothetical protein
MTTKTQTLTEFLLARIAEDEALATPAWPEDVGNAPLWDKPLRIVPDDLGNSRTEFHLAIHTARVLAECEAKRRIVEECERHIPTEPGGCDYGDLSPDLAERVLSLLALPYADHPDYREEWRA